MVILKQQVTIVVFLFVRKIVDMEFVSHRTSVNVNPVMVDPSVTSNVHWENGVEIVKKIVCVKIMQPVILSMESVCVREDGKASTVIRHVLQISSVRIVANNVDVEMVEVVIT